MPDSTLSALTASTPGTAGLLYTVQGGADRKLSMTAAGAQMLEAANAAAQQVLLGITGGGAISLGGYTLTVPATGTAALLGIAQSFTAAQTISVNGAVSSPAVSLTGTIYSGGTATTTKPLFLIEPSGTTSTGWSTGGTLLGLNATATTQDVLRACVNGSVMFSINGSGSMVLGSNMSPGTGSGTFMLGSSHGSNNKEFSFLEGYGGRINWNGERVMCNGYLVDWGDAQSRETVIRATTTNNTPTEMTGYNGQRLTLANDTTFTFEVVVTARRSDANDESAGYILTGVIDRNAAANTTALVGSVTKTVLGEDTAAWDVDATADTTNGALKISVTGENSKTIGWVACVRIVQVTI